MSSGARVLVVDDERAIRAFLRSSLNAEGYIVYEAATGHEALRSLPAHKPDIIILDLGLPDMDGTEVLEALRVWSDVPVIVLSVREREAEKIKALDLGADDYLTKPFSVGELLARMRAAFRRTVRDADDAVFVVGDLTVDVARRRVTLGDEEVSLTPTEYELLRTLVQHAGRVLTHTQLLQRVWGSEYRPDPHTLRVNVSNLRRKLEPDPSRPRYIITEPGVGYRLRDEKP